MAREFNLVVDYDPDAQTPEEFTNSGAVQNAVGSATVAAFQAFGVPSDPPLVVSSVTMTLVFGDATTPAASTLFLQEDMLKSDVDAVETKKATFLAEDEDVGDVEEDVKEDSEEDENLYEATTRGGTSADHDEEDEEDNVDDETDAGVQNRGGFISFLQEGLKNRQHQRQRHSIARHTKKNARLAKKTKAAQTARNLLGKKSSSSSMSRKQSGGRTSRTLKNNAKSLLRNTELVRKTKEDSSRRSSRRGKVMTLVNSSLRTCVFLLEICSPERYESIN